MGRGRNAASFENKFATNPGWYDYDGMVMTSFTPSSALDKIKEFEFHDDDVLCACYPKTGQTWMLSLLYMMKHSEEMEAGIPLTSSREQDIPFMELEWPVKSGMLMIDDLTNRPPPRYIKTHLPVYFFEKQLATKKTKVIQVLRNPKDTLVSYYHFHRANEALGNFEGSWDEFFEMVRDNDLITWGDIFEHTLGWWNLAQERENNIVFFYEEMKKDLRGTVIRLADFLGKNLSEKVIDEIVKKATFSNMKKDKDLEIQQNIEDEPETKSAETKPTETPKEEKMTPPAPTTGMHRVPSAPSCLIWSRRGTKEKIAPFMRKGSVGDWQCHFSEEQSRYVDERVAELLEPAGLTFTYNLS